MKVLVIFMVIGLMMTTNVFGQSSSSPQSYVGQQKHIQGKSTDGINVVPSVPNKMSYQGVLTTSSGVPAQDGSYDLKFELFNVNSGGSALWSETQTGVAVSRGTFSALLGSVTPLTGIFYQPLWLEVTAVSGPGISSSIIFSPRTEMVSSAYSLGPWMQTAAGAYYLNNSRIGIGKPPIEYWTNVEVTDSLKSAWYLARSFADYAGFAADKDDVTKNAYLALMTSGVWQWTVGTMNSNDFNIYYWPFYKDCFHIDTTGKIGIGIVAPTAKLDVGGSVKVKDTLYVGSNSQDGLFSLYQNGATYPVIKGSSWASQGGALDYYDENGSWIGGFEADVNGTGGWFGVSRGAGNGFVVDGNRSGTGDPWVGITGSSSSAVFNMTTTGDASVQLPDNSISSAEILDEPGISNSQSVAFPTNTTSGSTMIADSVDITIPASGYIEVTGGAWFNIQHVTGTTTEVRLGINTAGGSQDVYPGLGVVRLPAALPTNSGSSYGYPCTAHRIYTVTAGTYRYYLNLYFAGAGTSASSAEPWVRAVYYPTLYGTSTFISPTAVRNYSGSTDGSQAVNVEQITITPEQHLNELKAKAAALKSEIEETMKELGQKNGSSKSNGGN